MALPPRRLQDKQRMIPRHRAQVIIAQTQLLRLEQNVHQAKPLHAVIIVRPRTANHKHVAGIQGIRLLAGDVDAATGSNDDDLRKFMGMQPERFLGITPLHGNWEPVRSKPVFAFEDGVRHDESGPGFGVGQIVLVIGAIVKAVPGESGYPTRTSSPEYFASHGQITCQY